MTDTAENLALDFLNPDVTAPTRPTAPLMCRLMSDTTATDSTAGTEVTGDSYTPQQASVGAASGGTQTNTADIAFTAIDSASDKTVAAVELWDSATTPVRVWYGALSATKTVNAGDPFSIPAGDLDLALG